MIDRFPPRPTRPASSRSVNGAPGGRPEILDQMTPAERAEWARIVEKWDSQSQSQDQGPPQ